MRKPTRPLTLTRRLPDGTERRQTGLTRRNAGNAAFFALVDNRATTDRGAAAKAAEIVEWLPLGGSYEAYGYTFTLTEES